MVTAPDQYASDRRKNEAHDQQCRKNGLGRQDGLPRLEPLLLESSVWKGSESERQNVRDSESNEHAY